MTMGGIYACRWRELRPIIFGGSAAAAPRDGLGRGGDGPSTPLPGETGGDEEAGVVRRSGRGSGRDGARAYEMVEMKPEEDKGKPAPRLD